MRIAGGQGKGGKVIGMADRSGRNTEHPALAQLRAYWEALRDGGTLPSRAQIDPRGIERALEFAFIAERIAPGVARFRLAGMHLNDLMGMDVRGMPLTAFFEPSARQEAQQQVERAFAGPAAVQMRLEAERGIGRPALAARMLLLPLRNEAGDFARVLGGLAAEGGIGRAPRRFVLTGADAMPCGSGAAPRDADERPGARAAQGFAEAAGEYDPTPAKRGQPAHLRLVHSAD